MAPVAPRPPTQPRQPPQPLQQLLLPAPSLLPLPPVPGLTVLHPSLSPLCAPGGAAALFGGPGARFWSSGVAAAAPATAATTAAAAAASAAAAAFDGSEDVLEWPHRPVLAVGCVASAGGVSWRGRNPGGDKTNQDSVVLAEHAPSRSLLAGVFDGHGSQGRHVSRYFASVYPAALFGDPRFGRCMARTAAAGDAAAALSDGTHSTVSPRGGGVVFRDFCAATAAAAAAATASPSPTRRRSRSGAAGLRGAGGGSTGSRRSASAAPVGCSRHSDDVGGGDDRDSRGGGSGASSHDSPSPQHTQRRSGGSRSSPTHAHTLGLELCALMADVLLETEARLLSSSLIDTALSGTTCVLSLLRGGLVYTVNVGDSRSVLVRAPSALVPVREVDLAAASAVSTPTGDAVPGLALGLIPPPPPQPPPGEPPPPPDTITGAHHFAGPGHPPLASPAVAPACLTVDHKPDDPPERRRIAAAGGRVVVGAVPGLRHVSRGVTACRREHAIGGCLVDTTQLTTLRSPALSSRVPHPVVTSAPQIAGPARVWLPALQLPGLNMSRSLCDGLAKGAGVVSAPHGSVAVLSPVHRALVLGSDGVWDFVSPGEAGTLALSTANATEAAARLARLARSRWLHRTAGADDTTAVVVRLAPPDRELPPPQY